MENIKIDFKMISEIENDIQKLFSNYLINSGEIEFVLKDMVKTYVEMNKRLSDKDLDKKIKVMEKDLEEEKKLEESIDKTKK